VGGEAPPHPPTLRRSRGTRDLESSRNILGNRLSRTGSHQLFYTSSCAV